jgi:hypothetical protein
VTVIRRAHYRRGDEACVSFPILEDRDAAGRWLVDPGDGSVVPYGEPLEYRGETIRPVGVRAHLAPLAAEPGWLAEVRVADDEPAEFHVLAWVPALGEGLEAELAEAIVLAPGPEGTLGARFVSSLAARHVSYFRDRDRSGPEPDRPGPNDYVELARTLAEARLEASFLASTAHRLDIYAQAIERGEAISGYEDPLDAMAAIAGLTASFAGVIGISATAEDPDALRRVLDSASASVSAEADAAEERSLPDVARTLARRIADLAWAVAEVTQTVIDPPLDQTVEALRGHEISGFTDPDDALRSALAGVLPLSRELDRLLRSVHEPA